MHQEVLHTQRESRHIGAYTCCCNVTLKWTCDTASTARIAVTRSELTNTWLMFSLAIPTVPSDAIKSTRSKSPANYERRHT